MPCTSTVEKSQMTGVACIVSSRYCLRMLTINQPDNQDIKIITSGGAVLCSKPPKTLLICAAHYIFQSIKNVFSKICLPNFSTKL